MFELNLLLKKQPNKPRLHCFTLIIVFLICIMSNTYTYDKYNTLSQINDDQTLKIIVPENITINNKTIIQYKNKKYNVNEVEYLGSEINNNIIFKEILLNTDLKLKEDIITINILNNKQRIIKKIINIAKEN